jgi:predicted SAM-dependent methyltransferase
MLSSLKKKVRHYLYQKGYDVVYVNHAELALEAKRAAEIPEGTHFDTYGLNKVLYSCGWYKLQKGWLNVDYEPIEKVATRYDLNEYKYYFVNLIRRHPFADGSFEFGYSEDMMEHLMQADSLLFLSEAYRTFKKDGVLRLSFPCLEGVLEKHYPDNSYQTALLAKEEAYTRYKHLHFYSKAEIELVAKHLGFRNVEFKAYGESQYPELQGVDTREAQIGLNMYVELTK